MESRFCSPAAGSGGGRLQRLLLAALKVFGPGRGKAYAELPRWRRNARRPSCLDLLTLLRKEAVQNPDITASLGILHSSAQFVAAAAA